MLKHKKLRTNVFRVILFLCFGAIVVKLFSIQIVNHDKYVAEAEKLQVMQNTIVARRGEIYMMDGDENVVPVVMNAKVWTVIIDPLVSRGDRGEIEQKISSIAKDYVVISDWNEVFDSGLRYYVVARNVPHKQAQAIKEAELDGVWLQATTKRVYPEGVFAAPLLGFVNADGIGQYGVEGALNSDLAGENGVLKTVKDVNNIPLTIGNDNVKIPAVDGKNVVLTIDRNIQSKAEQILEEKTKEFEVENAEILVMDPNTGRVLAMAQTPGYDAADFGNVRDASVYQLDAVMDAYEPASVCKTFAFAATIDQGKMTPETTFVNNDVTYANDDTWPIRNLSLGHTGVITMQTGLSWSLNTASVQALRLLGGSETWITDEGKQKLFDYYYNRFGLGQLTGVELVEAEGLVYSPENAPAVTYANMTFGQGMMITPLQIATAFSSIVNGGDFYKPTVVAGEYKDGEFVKAEFQDSIRQTVSSSTSKTMRQMLVTARNLYKNSADYDSGLYIGGKTGTAQAVKDGAYVMNETVATYAGFGAESEDEAPKYVIVTKVWQEGRALDGGTHAKPLFDEMSKFLISYFKMKK